MMPRRFSGLILAFLIAAGLGETLPAQTPLLSGASAPTDGEGIRNAFLAIIDRPRVDLLPQETEQGTVGGIVRFHFSYASELRQRVPGILLAKQDLIGRGQRRPAVIILHGTGGSKESELPLLRGLAEKNFIAVAIDGRFHGERGTQADYNAAIAQAFEDGRSHPLYLDTVWDVMRLIDYLQTRPDVDGQRIGLMGISKGGIETWLTAAADTRVSVAVPCISVQSFQWGLQNGAWRQRVGTVHAAFAKAAHSAGTDKPDSAFAQKFYDRLLPGIYSRFDGPEMLPLIAPRPLLVISGENDPLNPIPGLNLCVEATKPAYAHTGCTDKFNVIIEPNTAHAVTKQATAAAVAWFEQWLDEPVVKSLR